MEGDLWRWDGYTLKAGTATAAASRLVERGRLVGLKKEATLAETRAAKAEAELADARKEAMISGEALKAIRQIVKEDHAELDRMREAIALAEHESLAKSKRLGALSESKQHAATALSEAQAQATTIEAAFAALAPLAALEAALETAQSEAGESRTTHARAEAALEGFEREIKLRQERLEAIKAEHDLWEKRIANAREQIETLRARETETSTDLLALANLPAEIEERRGRLMETMSNAERARAKAADDLAVAESALKEREKGLREVQERLAAARESRARSEARLEGARERRTECARAIREQLDCMPEACLALAGLKEGAELPPLSEVEAKLLKLKGDRERLGGVNLMAEEEEADPHHAARRADARARRRRASHHQASAGHLQSQPRRPQAPARSLRDGERTFPAPVQDAVRRRQCRAEAGRFRRSAGSPASKSSPARRASGRKS